MRPSDVRQRLSRALLRATEKTPDSPAQVALGGLALGLGIRKSTLSYYLNQFRRDGILRTRTLIGIGTELTVLDRDALQRLAHGEVKERTGGGDGVDPASTSTPSVQGAVARHQPPEREEVPR